VRAKNREDRARPVGRGTNASGTAPPYRVLAGTHVPSADASTMRPDNGGQTSRADRRRRGKVVPIVARDPQHEMIPSDRLLDRDLQLDELHGLFSSAHPLPSVPIVIEGRWGVGKTALLNSAVAMAAAAGWSVLRAKGSEAESSSPFGVTRQLLRPVLASRTDRVSRLPDGVGPRSGGNEHAAHERAAHEPASREAMFGVLDRVLDELSNASGALIAIDDAHWADVESSTWLNYVARRLAGRRLQLILTLPSRSAGLPIGRVERIVSDPSTRIVSLRPLGLPSVAGLIADQFEEQPDPAFADECFRVTQGNPRLLFALLDQLNRDGISPDGGVLDRVTTASPSTVARSVLVRLESQPEHLHRFLEAVALLGPTDDLGLGAHLADIDISTASAAVDHLASVDLLRRERPIGFIHPLVRSTVYRNIELSRRSALHLKAARFLHARDASIVDVGEHLLAAGSVKDEWASARLHQRGRHALEEGDHRLALQFLKRALADAPPNGPDPDLLVDLARAQAALGLTSSLRHVRKAESLGISPHEAATISLELVRSLQDCPRNHEAAAILRETADQLSGQRAPMRLELRVAAALFEPLQTALEPLLEIIRADVSDPAVDGTTAQRLALALIAAHDAARGDLADARQTIDRLTRAVAARELVVEDPMAMRLVAQAVLTLAQSGECAAAERMARDLCVIASRLGLDRVEAECSATLAGVRALQGAVVDSERLARRALDLADGRPFARRPAVIATLVESLAIQGRLDEAEEALGSHPGIEQGESPDTYQLLEMRGWLQVLRGRLTLGLANLFRAGRHADLIGVANPAVTGWRSRTVAALKELGRHDEAVELADDSLCRARAFGATWSIATALRDRAIVAPQAQRLALLQEASALLEESPARLAHASVLIHLGSTLFESASSPHEARLAIRRGAEIAWQAGALLMINDAERELRRTGAKPRRIALTGAESLTPSELRVALLAAEGKANADIARELVLSPKTVEGHLSRAYRKLGVRSRHELGSTVRLDRHARTNEHVSSNAQ
jgi:DNA-binding CsgD family transcriptional regulator